MDPGFFKRGGWHLGVPKSKEHAQKMWQFNNWHLPLIENYDKRNTSNVKVEIYQVTCLGCFPIFSTIFTFYCFIYIVLLKRGWLATQTTPPHPTPRSTTVLVYSVFLNLCQLFFSFQLFSINFKVIFPLKIIPI